MENTIWQNDLAHYNKHSPNTIILRRLAGVFEYIWHEYRIGYRQALKQLWRDGNFSTNLLTMAVRCYCSMCSMCYTLRPRILVMVSPIFAKIGPQVGQPKTDKSLQNKAG